MCGKERGAPGAGAPLSPTHLSAPQGLRQRGRRYPLHPLGGGGRTHRSLLPFGGAFASDRGKDPRNIQNPAVDVNQVFPGDSAGGHPLCAILPLAKRDPQYLFHSEAWPQ